MIIDAHAHVWPDHIAARMVAAKPVGLTPVGDGTVHGLLNAMDTAGIDMACTLAVANVAKNVARTNEFIGSVDRSRLVPFGTVHTGLTIEQNLASLDANGIRAVKFHPNFQSMSLVDPAVIDLMHALAERSVVVLAHAGEGSDAAATERGAPRKVATLVSAVPGLTLIACHFGGYHLLTDAEREVVGRRVILETSWPPTVDELATGDVRRIISEHGIERVVFGTDWPMANHAAELAAVRGWGLTVQDQAAVLGGNLGRIFGVTA